MSIRSIVSLLILCLALSGLPAAAQAVDLFAGFTAANMNPPNESQRATLNGWNGSLTVHPFYRVGFTADVAGQYGSVKTTALGSLNVRQHSVMAGPEIRLLKRGRFESSFKALFGAAQGRVPDSTGYGAEDTAFAALFGSNLDFNLSRRVAFRVSPGMFLTRYGEEIGGDTQRNLRISAGLVFRLGGE